jgi:hypothetical protein
MLEKVVYTSVCARDEVLMTPIRGRAEVLNEE